MKMPVRDGFALRVTVHLAAQTPQESDRGGRAGVLQTQEAMFNTPLAQ